MKSIQYATNQLASLNIQSSYDHSRFHSSNNPMNYIGRSLVQSSSNGFSRLSHHQSSRVNRSSNQTDKSIIPMDNEMKSRTNHNHAEQMNMPVAVVQRTD
jgi:hypothetical protein